MTVLISPAYAQGAPAAGSAGMESLLIMIAMFAVLWFIMIRPQMKRAKEHRAMIEALEKGAEVVTSGGVVGRITKIADAYVTLEVADNTEIVVQKQSVQTLLPKGTIKSI